MPWSKCSICSCTQQSPFCPRCATGTDTSRRQDDKQYSCSARCICTVNPSHKAQITLQEQALQDHFQVFQSPVMLSRAGSGLALLADLNLIHLGMSPDRSVLCITFEGGFKTLIVVFITVLTGTHSSLLRKKKKKWLFQNCIRHQALSKDLQVFIFLSPSYFFLTMFSFFLEQDFIPGF